MATVISRAAGILRALQQYPDGLSLGAIARLIGLPRSTVQRIVGALDQEGLVIAASATSGVRLGPAVYSMAAAAHSELAKLAHPLLVQLANETGETVDLAVLAQDKVVFVDQVPGTQRLHAASAIGVSFPLHCSSNGKALLAALKETELRKLRKRLKLTKFTERTLLQWEDLDRELICIRKRGVAFDREEHLIDVCAIAASLRSPTGELAAISIPIPAQRFASNQQALTKKLLKYRNVLQDSFLA